MYAESCAYDMGIYIQYRNYTGTKDATIIFTRKNNVLNGVNINIYSEYNEALSYFRDNNDELYITYGRIFEYLSVDDESFRHGLCWNQDSGYEHRLSHHLYNPAILSTDNRSDAECVIRRFGMEGILSD